MIETTIRWILLNDPSISDLVGDRILPVFNTQGTENYPAITYSRTGTQREYESRKATGQVEATIELTCWADPDGANPYGSAWELFERVRLCLSGWTETPELRAKSGGAIERVRRLFLQGEQDVAIQPQAGEGRTLNGVSCDLSVAYTETVRAYQ